MLILTVPVKQFISERKIQFRVTNLFEGQFSISGDALVRVVFVIGKDIAKDKLALCLWNESSIGIDVYFDVEISS